MSRELLQLAADTIEAMWDRRAGGKLNIDAASSSFIHRAQLTLAALRAALAQPETQPVNQQIESINAVFDAWRNGEDASMTLGLATPQAQPAPAVPADMVMVPLSFVQGFNTLAHNWSLRAEPPSFYTGTEGDAFTRAYAECGQALAKLRAMIASAPAVPADHWKSAVLDRLAILCLDAPIGEPPASILNRVIETEVMIALDPAVSEAAQALIDKGAAAPAVREPHEPYLCIKPACGPDCSGCNCAISPQDMRDYAVRYAILRNAPIDAIRAGGVFAGKTPDNVVLNGEHLDAAVDALRGITGDSK